MNTSMNSTTPFTSCVDLHVHSKHSDRPSEWLLRRIGSPECFVEPMHVYKTAVARGLNFVTISDHNKIEGALEIAHMPNTFISNEVTTYFPENGAKMHILVCGITEEQFRDIQLIRENIYEFRDYCFANNIVYSVAHPLFLVNEKLTIDQFEKLLVMFNRFELINGTRDPRASKMVEAILTSITPQMIERLADKHDIEPVGLNPHRKMLTGGSDDHSGLYVGSGHTITPKANSVEEFLDFMRQGDHQPGGHSGNSIHLAHCFYSIAYDYYKNKLGGKDGKGSLLGEMLKRLLEPQVPQTKTQKLKGYVGGWIWRKKMKDLSSTEQMLVSEFTSLFGHDRIHPKGHEAAHAFETSCKIAHQLGYTFIRQLFKRIKKGDFLESLQTVAALGPVTAAISPYLAAFMTQHKDEKFIKVIAEHFDATRHMVKRSDRKAWVTDTFDDVNGVTRTIQTLCQSAADQDKSLTVLSSVQEKPDVDFPVKNFKPVGQFKVPEYDQQQVSFPPFLEIIEYIERKQFDELIISTPGPMGLVALMAAKMLGLKTVGIYHTDFPVYVKCLTDDESLEAVTWKYMSWFYEQCDVILAPSEFYRRYLIEHGFDPYKIRVMHRGVDTQRFNPENRDENFWEKHGGKKTFTFSYVGRVSSEKNVDLLIKAFEHLLQRDDSLQLAIVGDGPMYAKLRKKLHKTPQVIFTGFIKGKKLARAYASSDVFVFPSTTDTFGNVVLEAHASGVPAIVSDRGGPQEIVGHNQSGVVVDLSDNSRNAVMLAEAMWSLATDSHRREDLKQRSLKTASESAWDSVLQTLWDANEPIQTQTETRPEIVISTPNSKSVVTS